MEDEDLERLYEEDDDYDDAKEVGVRVRKVPTGDLYEAARAGDVERVRQLLLEGGVNVNARDRWDSAPLYYACLAGHVPTARLLLESGAICAEHTFDGDRCHYAALNLGIRALLKSFEQRPPPLPPLHSALRSIFFSCPSNRPSSLEIGTTNEQFNYYDFASDITFFVQGRPIEAHRAILVARSPFFRLKFETDWKYRKEIRFSKRKLLYAALYSLIHFFYCDRLEIAVDDMENLVRICKVCKCDGLRHSLEKELNHQKYAEYKSLEGTDNSQKRFILHGVSLPEEERLPAAMHKLLRTALEKAAREMKCLQACFFESSAELPHNIERTSMVSETCINGNTDVRRHGDGIGLCSEEVNRKEWDTYSDISFLFQEHLEENGENQDKELGLCYSQHTSEVYSEDHADVCFVVEGRKFRSHQVILASRSEYFKARLSRATLFLEGKVERQHGALTLLEEHDLSSKAFEILLEYMYTDTVKNVDPELAEEMFDAASRYLIFPLKRAVADALLPHLENALPAELCQWLMLSDLYGVWKIREYCLDAMAFNFEVFAETSEFREMLLRLPPPSGDSSERTTIPSAPGEEGKSNDANILDDMRDKWLEAEAAELDKRDESALQFDKRLEMLIQQAEHENRQQKSQLV